MKDSRNENLKEQIKTTVGSYFIAVTLINLVIFVMGTIFRPEERFGYEAFLSPLIYGLISFIPITLFNLLSSGKELTIKQAIVRKFLELLTVEAMVIVFGLGVDNLTEDNIPLLLSFALSVLSVFVCVTLISWILDLRTARKLNEELIAFQSRHAKE